MKVKLLLYSIILFLLLTTCVWASPPARSYTYTTGSIIKADEVTTNEDNIYTYLSTGVDTIAASAVDTTDILDGTIANADVSGSAGITYGKLNLTGGILNADINSSAAIVDTKLATISTANKVNASALFGSASMTSIDLTSLNATNISINNTFTNTVANGTAPLNVTSSTKVSNLNADYLDGLNPGELGLSNIVFVWLGRTTDLSSGHNLAFYQGNETTPILATFNNTSNQYNFYASQNATFQTIFDAQFKKLSAINNVTIYAKLWSGDADAAYNTSVLVDIGGVNSTVSSSNSTTPTWYVSPTPINVTSLTNNTAYNVTVKMKVGTASSGAYCGGVILTTN